MAIVWAQVTEPEVGTKPAASGKNRKQFLRANKPYVGYRSGLPKIAYKKEPRKHNPGSNNPGGY